MLGDMIGDIAGSKYEFNNTFDYDFGMFGEGCDFTDDTICTVTVADAILNGRSYQESLQGYRPQLLRGFRNTRLSERQIR